jgi:hypothetical protein
VAVMLYGATFGSIYAAFYGAALLAIRRQIRLAVNGVDL